MALSDIRDANDIFFQIHKEENDTSFGDLIISKDSEHFSLTEKLINDRILARNESLFWKGKSFHFQFRIFFNCVL